MPRTASQARVAETVELPLNAFKKKSKEEVHLKYVCLKTLSAVSLLLPGLLTSAGEVCGFTRQPTSIS